LANSLLQSPYYAQYIVRNPTAAQIDEFLAGGRVNGAINPAVVTFLGYTQQQNLAITRAAGIDYELSYRWDTDIGSFSAAVYGTEFTRYLTAAAAGAPEDDMLDKIDNPPKTRLRADLGWDNGPWRVSTRFTWIGAYENHLVRPSQRVGATKVVDLHADYRFDNDTGPLANVMVALDVENLFDTEPEFVDILGGFDAQVASAIGRMVSLSVRKSW